MAHGDSGLDGQGPSTADDPPTLSYPGLLTSTSHPPPATTTTSSSPTSLAPTIPSTVSAAAASEPQQNGPFKAPDAAPEMSSHNHHYLPESGHHGGAAPFPPRLPSTTPTYQVPGSTPSNPYSPYESPTTQTNDAHRPSPAAPSPMSLPSMRTIDSMAGQASQNMSPGYGANLPVPPTVSSTPYYPGHNPSTVLPSNYGISPEALARYALPPDPRVLHRQPKKEIKRRTKTGCLTCRKRRIKCDETHPTCNNCKRSKRDCLGYDPIFRQQTVGRSNPPQPTTQNSPRSSSVLSSESSHRLPTPTSYSEPGTSFASGTPESHPQNPYSSQPPSLTDNYTSTTPPVPHDSLPPPPAASANPYQPVPSQRDLPIPALASSPGIKNDPVKRSSVGTYVDRPQQPLPSITQPSNALQPDQYRSSNHSLEGRKMRVEELINSWGPPPTAPEAIKSEDTYQEVVKVYHEMYAPGFHSFFESTWFYFSENGKMSFPRHDHLVGHMAVFLKVLEGVKVNDHAQMTYSGVLELRLVWELARMALSAAPDGADNRMRVSLPPENDPIEARHRFRLIEALLGGELIPCNPLTPPVKDSNPHRMREFEFWYQLGEFLRRQDGENGGGHDDKPREDALNRLRWLLDGRENRDVLYSIAVLRHYAHRFDMSQALQAKYHLPEEDPKNRVVVASKFISTQAHVTGGTTNVVRRLCDIASRLYVNPGDNIRSVARHGIGKEKVSAL